MNNITPLPTRDTLPPADVTVFAPASGAPRPLTVRRVVPSDPPDYLAPVIKLALRPPAPPDPLREPPREVPRAVRGENTAELAQMRNLARSVGQAAIEALAGIRPVHQLARWLDPENFDKLCRRAELTRTMGGGSAHPVAAGPHRNPVVTAARICPVAAGIYEAALVVVEQKKVRAVALRVERRRGLWKVTALEIG